jgi:hypothetical protein
MRLRTLPCSTQMLYYTHMCLCWMVIVILFILYILLFPSFRCWTSRIIYICHWLLFACGGFIPAYYIPHQSLRHLLEWCKVAHVNVVAQLGTDQATWDGLFPKLVKTQWSARKLLNDYPESLNNIDIYPDMHFKLIRINLIYLFLAVHTFRTSMKHFT